MLKLKSYTKSALVLALLVFVSGLVIAGEPEGDKGKAKLSKRTGNDHYMAILINNVLNYYSNNGDGSFNPYTSDNSGFEFPKGTAGADVIFEDGLVWGGFVFNGTTSTKKVGGSTYYHGLQAGKIITPGVNGVGMVAESPGLAKNRVFRVRPDLGPSTTESSEAVQAILKDELQYLHPFEPDLTTAALYAQYIKDWNEWPATDGAPYKDVNGNGAYNPDVDIPGVTGADQTLWYVSNDLDGTRTQIIGGVPPIGLEQQTTIWAYNRSGALGSAIFKKYKLINKSGARIDSTFLVQWSDPDLGGALGATDDFVGCDTLLNLGYVYNGTDNDGFYGRACPAGGFTFFQGPKVPGLPTDSAYFGGKIIKGFKNLKMTTFNMFINGNPTYTDPRRNSINGTNDWYNLMNGLVGASGAPYTNPITGKITKFVMSGDPVKSSGWIEGRLAAPGDRRMCQVTGPFTMAIGDTQEVVVSNLAAVGSDRLASVSLLKFYATFGQVAYNNNFDLASPPAAPKVTATALEGTIVLDWGDLATYTGIESQNFKGYTFQGYNVYQLKNNSPSLDGAKLLAVYDKVDGVGYIDDLTFDASSGTTLTKTVQFGTDYGLKRYYTTSADVLTSSALINGHPYYFAVTAYNYNGSSFPKSLESAPVVLTIIPQAPTPGTVLNAKVGDVVTTDGNTTKVGITDASIVATVVDPTRITGHLYKITVNAGSPKTWNVIDSTTGTVKAANLSVYGNDPILNPVVDGIRFSLLDPGVAGGVNNVKVTADPTNPTSVPYDIIRAASKDGKWSLTAAGATNLATAFSRINWQNSMGSNDYEIRVTGVRGGNTAGQGSLYYIGAGGAIALNAPTAADRAPIEVWNVTTNQRLLINMLDDAAPTLDNKYGPSTWATLGQTLPAAYGAASIPYERFYVSSAAPYAEPLPNTEDASGATEIFGRLTFVDILGTGYFPPVGTVIKFTNNKPVLPANAFVFNSSSYAPVTGSTDAAKTTVEKVNVWPNPYYGFNKMEANKYNRFVTITHLPPKATIRIFALSGILVRTLLHNDPSQFHTWDLNNESGLPVAAGMYVIHVDMPDLGTSKILKLGVIPEMQFLDRY